MHTAPKAKKVPGHLRRSDRRTSAAFAKWRGQPRPPGPVGRANSLLSGWTPEAVPPVVAAFLIDMSGANSEPSCPRRCRAGLRGRLWSGRLRGDEQRFGYYLVAGIGRVLLDADCPEAED